MDLHKLPDGRVLCHQSFGNDDGLPLLYCHGWPASRLEAALVDQLPVRLIAVDRPGYGCSTPQPGRALLDWPGDVASLLDSLHLRRVSIVGVSGGAPYAVACAHVLRDRVAAIALVSAVPPRPGGYLGNCPLEALYRLGRSRRMGSVILRTLRQLLLRGILGDRIFLNAALPQSDRDVLSRDVVSKLVAACREGVRPGIEGALSDAGIYARPWGFDLSEVTVPVSIWHGAMDSIVPARALHRWSSLSNVAINRMPAEGHYSIALRHYRRVIAHLAAHAGAAAGATDDRCGRSS